MAHIKLEQAAAWTEDTKIGSELSSLDTELESQVSTQILSRLSQRFDVTDWTSHGDTPALVKTLIAMYYVSYIYDRTYSTDDELAAYAVLLRSQADLNIEGLLSGAIDLPADEDANSDPTYGSPTFFPNDFSSSQDPTSEDRSLGPASFSMGSVF